MRIPDLAVADYSARSVTVVATHPDFDTKVFHLPVAETEYAQNLLGRRLAECGQVVTIVYYSTTEPQHTFAAILDLFDVGYRTIISTH